MIKEFIKNHARVKRAALAAARSFDPLFPSREIRGFFQYFGFLRDLVIFRKLGGQASPLDLYPCLFDKAATSGIDAHYFHQAIWAFRKILARGTKQHIDVGSEVNFVGLLTTITEVAFVDIRPLLLNIPNYTGIEGSILALPYENGSVVSFSSLHVIEHVGLGRYGDPLDPDGAEKAAREVVRVLAPGGVAYISVPVGRPRVQFNGQRVFTVTQVLSMFAGLQLQAMALVNARGRFIPESDPDSADICEEGTGLDYGLGLFEFVKPEKTSP